jgi:hypothetical protein
MQAVAKRTGLAAVVELFAPAGEFLHPDDERLRSETFRPFRSTAVDLHDDDIFFNMHVDA